jgi:hypothetical protein
MLLQAANAAELPPQLVGRARSGAINAAQRSNGEALTTQTQIEVLRLLILSNHL